MGNCDRFFFGEKSLKMKGRREVNENKLIYIFYENGNGAMPAIRSIVYVRVSSMVRCMNISTKWNKDVSDFIIFFVQKTFRKKIYEQKIFCGVTNFHEP